MQISLRMLEVLYLRMLYIYFGNNKLAVILKTDIYGIKHKPSYF